MGFSKTRHFGVANQSSTGVVTFSHFSVTQLHLLACNEEGHALEMGNGLSPL